MLNPQANRVMVDDIRNTERRLLAEHHASTRRALLYIEAGLTRQDVLDALGISQATWYRRVQDLRQADAEG